MVVERCLWFKYFQNYEQLIEALYLYPKATFHLCMGLGIAIAFTQISQPDKIWSDIQRFPEELQLPLKKGAGISLASAYLEDPSLESIIQQLYGRGNLAPYKEMASRVIFSLEKNSHWYRNILDKIQNVNVPENVVA